MKVRLSIAPLSILGSSLIACYLGSYFLETAALALEDKVHSAAHSIQGRILLSSPNQNVPIKVSLSKTSGSPDAREERTLGYDGTFSYENVTAGNYLLTIESQDLPTIARAVELKGSLTPKTVFLTFRLAADGSATIQEVLKDTTSSKTPDREDIPTAVSKKAFKAFQKAAEESSKGNNAEAIEHLRKAITEEPNYFEAYNNLGAQYQKLKRWEEAIEAFSKAIALGEQSVKPHINLGTIYLSLGEPDSAIKHFQSVLNLDMSSVPAHLGLGQALFQKKDYDSAVEHLETATRLDPRGTKQAFMLLTQILVLNKRYDRARYFLKAMAEFFPNDPEVSKLSQSLNYLSDNLP
jgi:Flp pilus assembly protein TadD